MGGGGRGGPKIKILHKLWYTKISYAQPIVKKTKRQSKGAKHITHVQYGTSRVILVGYMLLPGSPNLIIFKYNALLKLIITAIQICNLNSKQRSRWSECSHYLFHILSWQDSQKLLQRCTYKCLKLYDSDWKRFSCMLNVVRRPMLMHRSKP